MDVSKRLELEGGEWGGKEEIEEGETGGGGRGGNPCVRRASPARGTLLRDGLFGVVLLRHIRASVICQLLEWSLYIIPVCTKSRTQIMSTKKPRQLNKLLEMSGF